MKRILLALAVALVPAWGFACDTYTSIERAPGERVLHVDGFDLHVTEDGEDIAYSITSAGTGTGIMVAWPEDGSDGLRVKTPDNEYWLGPERFVEYCR